MPRVERYRHYVLEWIGGQREPDGLGISAPVGDVQPFTHFLTAGAVAEEESMITQREHYYC